MNIPNQARQETASQRQKQEHIQETMTFRAEAEVKAGRSEIEERAREEEAATRQNEDRLKENMASRSQEELGDR